VGGTVQNDILKEYAARGTYIYPPGPSMKLVTDVIEFCSREVPRWNTISVSGYHMREAGCTAVQEVAFTLAAGLAYVEAAVSRGLDVDAFAPRMLATVMGTMRSLKETDYGPVTRELLSEIARNPELGDPFRATVVQARRDEIARVIARGVRRGDLRPDVEPGVATEMLIGPVYWRLLFGGELDADFAEHIVDEVLQGWSMRGWGEVATNWL
jgi:hypothetical protein